MGVIYTPTTITTGYNLTKLNANFTAITAALLDAVSRSGAGTNTLSAALDANSNKIINLSAPTNGGDAINKTYGDATYGTAPGDAADSATESAVSAAAALVSEGLADDDATAAAVSAAAAAATAVALNEGLTTTSTTSITLEVEAALAITTADSGLGYVPGHPINLARTSNPSNFNQLGTVVSYSGTSLVMDVDGAIEGSGTFSDWTISIGGLQGATGPTGATGTAGAAGSMTEKVYTGGVDYTIDSSTTLTLLATVTSEEYIQVYFDSAYQDRDSYSVSGTTVTFDAPIPATKVSIVSTTAFGIGTPSDNTVTSAKIVDGTIETGDIKDLAVTAGKIATGTITTVQMGTGSVDTAELASSAVETAKINNLAVTTAKIAVNAVDETKLKDALVADFSEVTVAAGDSFLLGDVSDSGNTKKDTIQGILDLVMTEITLDTERASTSGTAITFTGIPSGVKRIVVSMRGVSSSAAAGYEMTIGDSGGLETSGYSGGAIRFVGSTSAMVGATDAWKLVNVSVASETVNSIFILSLQDAADDTWNMLGASGSSDTGVGGINTSQGGKQLDTEITQLSITANGDTFDAGAINIAYQ